MAEKIEVVSCPACKGSNTLLWAPTEASKEITCVHCFRDVRYAEHCTCPNKEQLLEPEFRRVMPRKDGGTVEQVMPRTVTPHTEGCRFVASRQPDGKPSVISRA